MQKRMRWRRRTSVFSKSSLATSSTLPLTRCRSSAWRMPWRKSRPRRRLRARATCSNQTRVEAALKRYLFLTCLAMACVLPAAAQQYAIKFATLAPEGSTWLKVMRDFDKAVREDSGGRLGFKLYPGGVAGDEKDVIRKIRLGQYNGGGFTGI